LSDGPSHPSNELLAAYTSGTLPTAPGLVVACHLDLCSDCSAMVRRLEEVGGALLCDAPSAELSAGAVDKALAILEEPPPVSPATAAPRASGLPPPLARARVGPRRWFGPGRWIAAVRTAPADHWRTFLLRAPLGAAIPSHGHGGPEYVCVLEGAFQNGGVHVRGDFLENPDDHEHRLHVTSGGPCLCVIATQGPLKWGGPMRLLAPLLGI
jgi:putative transcriptional regulator